MSVSGGIENVDKFGKGKTRFVGESQSSSPINDLLAYLGTRLNSMSAANQKLYNGANTIATPVGQNWYGMEYDPSGQTGDPRNGGGRGNGGNGNPTGNVSGTRVSGQGGGTGTLGGGARGNGSFPGGRGGNFGGGPTRGVVTTDEEGRSYSGLEDKSLGAPAPKDAYESWKSGHPNADAATDAFMKKTMTGQPVGASWSGGGNSQDDATIANIMRVNGGDPDKAAAWAQGILGKYQGQVGADGEPIDPWYAMNTLDHGSAIRQAVGGAMKGNNPKIPTSAPKTTTTPRGAATSATERANDPGAGGGRGGGGAGGGAEPPPSGGGVIPGGGRVSGGSRGGGGTPPPVTTPPPSGRSTGNVGGPVIPGPGYGDPVIGRGGYGGGGDNGDPGTGTNNGTGMDPSWPYVEYGNQFDMMGTLTGEQTGGQGDQGIVGGYGKLYNSEGYDPATKAAMAQESMGAARAATAGAQADMTRKAATSGNKAGLYSGLANVANTEQKNFGSVANQNVLTNFTEKQRQKELGLGGMKDLYSMNQAEQQSILQGLLGLAKTPRETTENSSAFGTNFGIGG